MQIGAVEIFLLTDGFMRADGGGMFGLIPRVMWEIKHAPDELNRVAMRTNFLLVKDGDRAIVIDTGMGAISNPRIRTLMGIPWTGRLPELLRLHGVELSQVNLAISTHLHFDHAGGNTVTVGDQVVPAFPNATYFVQRREWEDAMNPNERTRGTYNPKNLIPMREAGQLELIEGDTRITPHVRCLVTPGHTASHQSVVIESEGQTAVYLADVAPFAVHLEHLHWVAAYDLEPMVSMETRRGIQRGAVDDQPLLIFPHDPLIGMGRLQYRSGRYWVESVARFDSEDSCQPVSEGSSA